MFSRRTFLISSASLAVVGMAGPVVAASPEVFSTNGMAIHGYDPVAYFTEKKPVSGVGEHSLKWMGVTWLFSSAKNMAAFEANPRNYAPQYGGYCAYAMAQGAVATTVPEAWTVHKGKLYLNFSTGVRGIWQKDIPGNIKAADRNWPAALKN